MTELSFDLVYEEPDGMRVDKFLAERLPEFSRSRIQQLIKQGNVLINGQLIDKSGTILKRNQRIFVQIPPAESSDLVPENIPLDILFENQDLIVVNKPAGMVVHPSHGHSTGTLVHAILSRTPDLEGIGGEIRPGIVHRLDKDTSGILLVAKNERTLQWLQEEFRKRRVVKEYLALVDGHPPSPVGRIEASIGRDPNQRKRMAVVPDTKGREAITEYKTLKTFPNHTLLSVHILTGRTHQIRLHLAFLGCPVTGDTVYGHRKPSLPIHRQFLHAFRIAICLPYENERRTFEAALPDELQIVLNSLSPTSQ